MANTEELSRRLGALVVFRSLRDDSVVRTLERALRFCADGRAERALGALAEFESKLFPLGDGDWSRYLTSLVLQSDNACVRCAGKGLSAPLRAAMEQELLFLQELSQLRLEALPVLPGVLIPWETSETDLPEEYHRCLEESSTRGYGIFASHHVFTVENGALTPVRHPDPQALDELPGYERERAKIIANTEALLSGGSAGNVLLYGDAGTGKSSTVKAIANAFAPRGLRLVEVRKDQLFELPGVMETLAENPLKFIVFIDDLSFAAGDDNFAALKAVLEGNVGARPENTVVYATSNRRHLVRETMEDRAGDDIHASDTRQELMSLSARFGLIVTFERPDRERYRHIVSELAQARGLERDGLIQQAEAFAIRAGGRSARAAKQFVELCCAGVL